MTLYEFVEKNMIENNEASIKRVVRLISRYLEEHCIVQCDKPTIKEQKND
jgi:hypothetical protein